jgi:hypothetical protein
MSEMVERVARAMAVVDKGDDMWDVVSDDGDGYGYVGKNEYRAMARAAIEAMREPTEAMIRRLSECDLTCGYGDVFFIADESAKDAWKATIDEALK